VTTGRHGRLLLLSKVIFLVSSRKARLFLLTDAEARLFLLRMKYETVCMRHTSIRMKVAARVYESYVHLYEI